MSVVGNIFDTILFLTLPFMCWEPLVEFKPATTTFDFIIVGAGVAGSVVANRLSSNPYVKVLLVEAGGCPILRMMMSEMPAAALLNHNSEIDWKFKIAPQKKAFLSYINNQAKFPQGRVLGGTGTINDMMYVRANHRDFNDWELMGNEGWNWNDVLPYYLKSEGTTVPWQIHDHKHHNVDGPLVISESPYKTSALFTFIDSCQEQGLPRTDTNGFHQLGCSPITFSMKNGARFSAAKAFLNPVKNRKNLFISTNSEVLRIIFDNDKRAIGVELIHDGHIYVANALKEVILSAGALNSPKLLMLSGIGPASHIQKFNIPIVADRPGVGQNLQDHVGCGHMIWKVDCSDCTYDLNQAMSLSSIFQWLLFRNGPVSLAFANEGMAFLKTKLTNPSDYRPDIEIQFVSANAASHTGVMEDLLGISHKSIEKYYRSFAKAKATFSIYPFLEHPKSKGSITLQSRDYKQPPIIDFNYLSHEDDIRVLVEGVKAVFDIGNSPAFQSLGARFIRTVYPGCHNMTQFSDEYWECTCRHFTLASYHAVGSCKMGPPQDNMAVVNSKLEVYGVSNLRVIDASIMPKMVTGNIMATVLMIAEKAAEQICEDYNYYC